MIIKDVHTRFNSLLFTGICACLFGFIQEVNAQAVLSPQTRMAKIQNARKSPPGITKSAMAEKQVGVYLEVSDATVIDSLHKLGFNPIQHRENVLTMRCSLADMDRLVNIPGIVRIQLSAKPRPLLYRTTKEVGAADAYNGVGDPVTYYTGEGVVVGILDFGFDLTHPAFYNPSGTTRIVRVWDQSVSGTHPSGYSYGAEYTTAAAIAQKAHTSDEYHGTHVLGIAAGKGVGTTLSYQGIAPKADIVLVELGEDESDLCDAIKYVFDYATSVNKPAVINMSLGSHMGPHDGTSYMDRLIDSYSGAGKIIVGAAGNEGNLPMHLSKVFTTKAKMHTIIDFYEDGNTDSMTYVDI